MLAYLKYQWSLGEDLKQKEAFARLQELALELSSAQVIHPVAGTGYTSGIGTNVPLIARVYLKLGTWQWALFLGLDDDPIQEILAAFGKATQCAKTWAKAWHTWALFNTTVMSHYTLRGFPVVASQFVVAAATRYFHSIACATHAKGVDDSLQAYRRELLEAYECCMKYKRTGKDAELTHVIFYSIGKRLLAGHFIWATLE